MRLNLTMGTFIVILGLLSGCSNKISPLPPQKKVDYSNRFTVSESYLSLSDFIGIYPIDIEKPLYDFDLYEGDSLQLLAVVNFNGLEDLEYQWYKDGLPTESDNPSDPPLQFTLNEVTLDNTGTYKLQVFITDTQGERQSVFADFSNVNVQSDSLRPTAPEISVHTPLTQERSLNTSVFFEVSVQGRPTPTLQWYKNGSPINGETSPLLRISDLDSSDEGSYYVVASNGPNTDVQSPNMGLSLLSPRCFFRRRTGDGISIIDTVFPNASPIRLHNEICVQPAGSRSHSCVGDRLARGESYFFNCNEEGISFITTEPCNYRTPSNVCYTVTPRDDNDDLEERNND